MSQTKYISVDVKVAINVTIVFNSLQDGSELERLVRDLKREVEKFDGLAAEEATLPVGTRTSQAHEVNARYGSLADFLGRFPQAADRQQVLTAVDTAVAIIARYDQTAERDASFSNLPKALLAQRVHALFDLTIGNSLNERFWPDLWFYEWASRKKLVPLVPARRRFGHDERPVRPTPFSDLELDNYFIDHEDAVLRRLMREAKGCEVIALEDPIGSDDGAACYRAFMLLSALARG